MKIINIFVIAPQPHPSKIANKTEDDEEAENSDFPKEPSSINRNKLVDFSHDALSNSLRRPSSFALEDDHDSEMASMEEGVSELENNNDISMNNLQSTSSSNNFARSFINNTARRMSSGIVLSYNFLKGANSNRRDST